MIVNVIDRRTSKYNVNCNVIFEPAWQYNSCKDATQFKVDDSLESIIGMPNTTVPLAIAAMVDRDGEWTMYLYDQKEIESDRL